MEKECNAHYYERAYQKFSGHIELFLLKKKNPADIEYAIFYILMHVISFLSY